MSFMNRSSDHPFVRGRTQCGMSSIGIVPNITQELGLARTCSQYERVPLNGQEHLSGTDLLHGSHLFERFLVQDLDHLTAAFVNDDLFLPELHLGCRHPVPCTKLA